MANSMFIPLAKPPADLPSVDEIVQAAFLELAMPAPTLRLHRNDETPATDIRTSFVMVEGPGSGDFCWASFDDVSAEVTEDAMRPFMADVTTRGSWRFAGAVAYAFCRHEGSRVFNDSGALDGTPQYDAETLRAALLA